MINKTSVAFIQETEVEVCDATMTGKEKKPVTKKSFNACSSGEIKQGVYKASYNYAMPFIKTFLHIQTGNEYLHIFRVCTILPV